MKIPIVSRETGEFFFDLDIPFREWREWKKAAREAGMSVEDWLEMIIRTQIKREKSTRRWLRFQKLKLDKLTQ